MGRRHTPHGVAEFSHLCLLHRTVQEARAVSAEAEASVAKAQAEAADQRAEDAEGAVEYKWSGGP